MPVGKWVMRTAESVLALDEVGALVEPTLFGLALLDDLELPSPQRRVAPVHGREVAREEVRLLASFGAADLQDDVSPDVRVAREQEGLEVRFELGDPGFEGVHLGAPLLAVVAARLVEHLLGGDEVLPDRLQRAPRVVDLGEFLMTAREVAQTVEVARDVGFAQSGLDLVQFVLKRVQGVVNGAQRGCLRPYALGARALLVFWA